MLLAYAFDFQGNYDKHLTLVEFTYNNNYQASIKMAPCEALYGRRCPISLCSHNVGQKKL